MKICIKVSQISFIVTTYNYGNYLKECINSIIFQEGFDNNKIIVIDDGSTDNTYSILREYINKKFFEYIRIDNSGVEYAANYAVSKIKTKYFTRLDADDSLKQNYLKFFNKSIKNNYDFVYSDYDNINEFSDFIETKKLPDYDLKEIFKRGDFLASGTLYKKKAFDFINGYETEFKNCGLENYSLIIRLILSNFSGFHIRKNLFNYRIHSKNMSKLRREYIIKYGNMLTLRLLNKAYEVNQNHPYGLKI